VAQSNCGREMRKAPDNQVATPGRMNRGRAFRGGPLIGHGAGAKKVILFRRKRAGAEVKAVWDRTVADLEAMGIASSADANQAEIYAEAVVLHRKASRLIAQSSILLEGA
jgi:hypothetical protein